MKIILIKLNNKKAINYVAAVLITFVILNVFANKILKFDLTQSAIKSLISTLDGVSAEVPHKGGKLSIVIDDFGQSRDGVNEMMSINEHLTFAVLPFMEHSQEDAQNAHEKGYEVIVHLPMEPNQGKPSWLGPSPIMAGMSTEKVKQIVSDSFENVPYAVGANIHMGSKASSEENIVSSVLDIVKDKNFYFVDSRTADHPIGKKLADERGVLCYDRDVFLDGQKPKSYVKSQLIKAEEIALKKGNAVAIGHVGMEGGKVTAQAICEMSREFENKNVKLVFVSELK